MEKFFTHMSLAMLFYIILTAPMLSHFLFYGVEFSIATIITTFAISAMLGGIVKFLKKVKATIIKTEVSGMRLG